jgi:hypothetical protein
VTFIDRTNSSALQKQSRAVQESKLESRIPTWIPDVIHENPVYEDFLLTKLVCCHIVHIAFQMDLIPKKGYILNIVVHFIKTTTLTSKSCSKLEHYMGTFFPEKLSIV